MCSIHLDDATAAILRQNAHHAPAYWWRGDRVMKPISVWGWLGGHDGQRPMGKFGQDAGVTPLLFFEGHPGIFNDHRESGPRFNVSSEGRIRKFTTQESLRPQLLKFNLNLSILPSIKQSIYLFIYHSVYRSIYRFVYLFIYLSSVLSIYIYRLIDLVIFCLFIHLFVCLFILSVFLLVCLSVIRLFVCSFLCSFILCLSFCFYLSLSIYISLVF